MSPSIFFFICSLFGPCGGAEFRGLNKFLIASTPKDSKVSYMALPSGSTRKTVPVMTTLIGTGLVHPQGVAVDQKRKMLFVADPDARKIFSYNLTIAGDTIQAGPQTVAVDDAEVRWLTVDTFGNIFMTDEAQNMVLKLPVERAVRGDTKPEVVYDGMSFAQVSAPGGIARDAFHTYWTNKALGSQVGSVVKGGGMDDATKLRTNLMALSKNTDKSYGVCLAMHNIFYTQPESTIYGVKKTGGEPHAISDRLQNPRGCAWDGEGTVYVADRGSGAIFSFAGNMPQLAAVQLTKAVDFDDAFGIAILAQKRPVHKRSLFSWR